MMKRFVVICSVLFISSSLLAVVNLDHSTGLFRIPVAGNQGKGQFTFDVRYMVSYFDFEDSFPTTLYYYDTTTVGGITVIDTTIVDSTIHTGDAIVSMTIPFGMSYCITDHDEIGLGWVYYYDAVLTQSIHIRPDNPGYIDNDSLGHYPYFGRANVVSSGIGDLTLFYKRTFDFNEKFSMGALAEIIVPTGSEREENFPARTEPDTLRQSDENIERDGGVFRDFRQGFGGGISLMGTMKPTQESPIAFTGLLGYRYHGYSEHQILNLGLGTQFKGKYFEPYVELSGDFYLNDDSIANPFRVTPGIRFTSLPGLFLDIAYDFRLTENNQENVESYGTYPDWQASIGFGWTHDFMPPKPKLATIAGTVIDADTKLPIPGAILSFSDTLIPNITTDEFGIWMVSGIEAPIDLIVEADAEGYLGSDPIPMILYPGDLIEDITIALNEQIIQGSIKGIVYELGAQGDITPIVATLNISGDTTAVLPTNEFGEFEIILSPGSYSIEASVPGYIAQSKDYSLAQDQILTTEFHLLKERAEIVFHNINFEVNKSDILPESYPILDQVAAILRDNPSVRIEIQGHTDSDGSRSYNQSLSEARANSVRSYLLNTEGISPDRLIARGYGEDRLAISPERSAEDKRFNRRVEFHVLEN
ncbi:MAG: hypothetical protein APR63_02040 [Desulfuromonas sp. SDB]|nr:MAG: hypothetical protein APR63_02040 [Desulfuromonas sp. SDB]